MLRFLSLRIEATFTIHHSQSYRKKLPLDYKLGNKHSHKNPHAIPMRVKDHYLKVLTHLLSRKKEAIGRKLDSLKGRVWSLLVNSRKQVVHFCNWRLCLWQGKTPFLWHPWPLRILTEALCRIQRSSDFIVIAEPPATGEPAEDGKTEVGLKTKKHVQSPISLNTY